MTPLEELKDKIRKDNSIPVNITVVELGKTSKFDSFAQAKEKFPLLELDKNTRFFTWGMLDGENTVRFESWPVYELFH